MNHGFTDISYSMKNKLTPAHCAILTLMTSSANRPDPLKPLGFLLLLMGWVLALSAIVLLKQEAARGGFVLAGLAVESARPVPRSAFPHRSQTGAALT